MFIDLTPEQRQLQAELREYFSNLISPEEAKAMESDRHNEAYRAVIRRMGLVVTVLFHRLHLVG